jgi:hypothetical protein
MKKLTLKINFNKSLFKSKPDNSLEKYNNKIKQSKKIYQDNQAEIISKIGHQIPGYENY